MRYLKLFIFTALWLPAISPAFAQSDSASLEKYPTRFSTEYNIERGGNWRFEDTMIRKNEIYHTMYRKYGAFQDLGNVGTPGRNLFFEPNRNTDFYFTFNPWQSYFKTPQATRYYNTKTPYADISYVQGPMDLLMLNARFSVNVSPRFNFGVDYDRVTSLGFYPKQYTSGYFTNVYASYNSLNKRYMLLANVNFNRGVVDESGGISSDSLFESIKGANKAGLQPATEPEPLPQCNLVCKTFFYLGKMHAQVNNEDTTYQVKQNAFISHTIRFDMDKFAFDNNGDSNRVLFPNRLVDTVAAFYDSISSKALMNRLAYAFRTTSSANYQNFIEFAIAHKYIEAHQFTLNHFYNNVWGEVNLERIPKNQNNIGVKLQGSYCMLGYNQNDAKLSGDVKWTNRLFDIAGGMSNQLYTPDYTQVYYRSGPYSWTNRFSKINMLNWRVGVATKIFGNNLYISFNQYIINNYVYNGEQVVPVQTDKTLLVNTFDINKTFQAWIFYFENRVMVQHTNLDVVRMPSFATNLRYYINGFLFKRALQLQVGAELFYNTAYYGNAYHPSTRVFYLQNQTLIGNYPLVDVFVTGQIKKAIIFAKLEHVNMDMQNYGFYYTPHYPLPIRAFRIGVRWRMYN